jgi:hypothetical protein
VKHPTSPIATWLRRLVGGAPRRRTAERPRLRLELLETRDCPAALVPPDASQQYMLELINRMRLDPTGELTRLTKSKDVTDALAFFATDLPTLQQQFNGLTKVPALAWSDQLAQAAVGHSRAMLTADQQVHQVLPNEPDLGKRVMDAGYAANAAGPGENILAYANDVAIGHAAFAVDWGFGPNGLLNPTGHRDNIMSANFTDVGIGIVKSEAGKKTGPLLITQNFAAPANPGDPFLLGVVYGDKNKNGSYDAGEGLANVTVTITGPNGPLPAVTTSDQGYYQVQVPAGTYNLEFTGAALPAPETRMGMVGTTNVKQDVKITVNQPPVLALAQGPYAIREDVAGGQYKLRVTRTGDPSVATSVTVTATPGTALTPANFTLRTPTLDFLANETAKDIVVDIVNVPGANGNLNFTLALSIPNPMDPGTLGQPAQADVTIVDADPAPSQIKLDQAAYTVKEDAGTLRVNVTRTGNTALPATVVVAASDGTAKNPANYVFRQTTVAFAAGETSKPIDITINKIPGYTGDLQFSLTLSGTTGNGTLIDPKQAQVTIQDTDPAPDEIQLGQDSYTINENAGPLKIIFIRTGNTAGLATVTVTATPGTAKDGTNYQFPAQTVTFASGSPQAEATVQINNIPGFTGDLSFTVAISNPTGLGAKLGPRTTAAITIKDVDPAPPGGNVVKPPDAKPDLFALRQNDAASTGPSVLANDSSPDNLPLTARLATPPALGTVTLNADGTFTYRPGANFWGVDTFTYTAFDGRNASAETKVTVLSQNALQVRKLYLQVLKREPDPLGWQDWTGRLTRGQGTLGTVASGIFESEERLNPIIAQMYRDYLLREPDQLGLAAWRAVWQRDGGPENVFAGILDSVEFFTSAGGTNEGWVRQLYRRLLGREVDPTGFRDWTGLLANGTLTRQGVVIGIIKSIENSRNLVFGWFNQYLGRPPSAAELDANVAQLQKNVSQRAIQIQLIDSPEYFNAPPPPDAGTARRVQ